MRFLGNPLACYNDDMQVAGHIVDYALDRSKRGHCS